MSFSFIPIFTLKCSNEILLLAAKFVDFDSKMKTEETDGENLKNLETPQNPSDSREDRDPTEAKPAAALDQKEIFKALEIVERASVAIAESYASLFSSLLLALSEVSSIKNHQQLDLARWKQQIAVLKL